MSQVFQHNCIKIACGKQYSDSDPDAYYCPDCTKEAKVIAAKIDKQLKSKISKRKTMSDLQVYETSEKVHGFMRVKL